MDLQEIIKRVDNLFNAMNSKQIEREHVINMLIITFFAKKNIFLLGEPGVSKTGILEIFSTLLSDGNVFDWTIKDDTKYEELFGDRYRDEDGKMISDIENTIVDSHITILDEIWKGNSKILNGLLSATSTYRMVEIRGRGRIHIPNIATFAASNELPSDKSLKALKDRFNVMLKVIPIVSNDNWKKFISGSYDKNKKLDVKFSINEVEYVYREAMELKVNEQVYSAMLEIKNRIKSQGIACSDRRFDGSVEILKVSAFLNGDSEVGLIEILHLKNMIWEEEVHIPRIEKIIDEVIFGKRDTIEKRTNENIAFLKSLDSIKNNQFQDFLKFRTAFTSEEGLSFIGAQKDLDNLIKRYCETYDKFFSNVNLKKYIENTEHLIHKHKYIKNTNSDVFANEFLYKRTIANIANIEKTVKSLKEWKEEYSTITLYNAENRKRKAS